MKTTKKEISKNKIKITVSIDPEKMEQYFEAEYARLAPTISLPGFRPGKAPRVMTVEAIGQTRLSQAALEQAIDESFRQSLKEHKAYPVTQPAISITKYPAFGEDKAQNELVFDIEFDILPKAKIGSWKKIKVKPVDPQGYAVTAEEVERVIEYLRRQGAVMNDIDRSAQKGDWVQIAFKGSQKHVQKDKLSSPSFPLVIGENNMVPGFEDELIGMKKGEKKEFDITFPKDFQDKEFANQKIHFELDLEEIKDVTLPDINDQFAERFGHKNINALKDAIKTSLVQEKKDREFGVQQAQIAGEIVKMTKVDIPASLIDQEFTRMKALMEEDLKKKGLTYEKYLENMKITPEKGDQDLKEQSKRNIILGVGLGEIAQEENIEMTDQNSARKVYDRIIELCSR